MDHKLGRRIAQTKDMPYSVIHNGQMHTVAAPRNQIIDETTGNIYIISKTKARADLLVNEPTNRENDLSIYEQPRSNTHNSQIINNLKSPQIAGA
jgi:hypothetical protein